jgi:hypothetical protein
MNQEKYSINENCWILVAARASVQKLEGYTIPDDFNPEDIAYDQIIAHVRHEFTNYVKLLMDFPNECPVCTWNNDEEGCECISITEARDILKEEARSIAVGFYNQWLYAQWLQKG